MKQHITVEQLGELSDRGRNNLKKWWKPKKGDLHVREENTVPPAISKHVGVINHLYEFNTMRYTSLLPLLSMGQMIEFLEEDVRTDWSICFGKDLAFVDIADRYILYGKTPKNRKGELCDGLWELVKEVLEND